MDAALIGFTFSFWLPAQTLYVLPVGIVPVDSRVADYLAWALREPRSEFFTFELRGFLIYWRSFCAELPGIGIVVTVFVTFGIPDKPSTTHPLRQNQPLLICWVGFESDALKHDTP